MPRRKTLAVVVVLGACVLTTLLGGPGREDTAGATAGGSGGSSAARSARLHRGHKPPPAQFGRAVLRRAERARGTGRIVVRFEPGARKSAERAALDRADADVERQIPHLDTAVVDPGGSTEDALDELMDAPAVAYAEPEVVLQGAQTSPNDMLWTSQWGLRLVQADAAWDALREPKAVVVAVLDTGADGTHPDLQGAFVPGWNTLSGDANTTDDNGHGTEAAGVVAARTNNAEGGAGMCSTCSVMPVKVLDSEGNGTTASVAAGIVWATDHGARVISMSLGATSTTQVLADAVAYAVSHGIVLVAAAGNDGAVTPFYPAAYPGVVGVAATDSADGLYTWSNRGSWVQVAAPGCNPAPAPGGSYVEFCGTSSATPVVAGIAGLALSARPDATAADVARALLAGVVPLPAGAVRYGRVNARAALQALGLTVPSAPPQRETVAASVLGRLDGTGRAFRVVRDLGAWRVTAVVTARPRARVVLTLLNPSDRTVRRVSGRTPLRLSASVAAGIHTIVVSGRARASVRLAVLYVGAAKGST